MKTKWAVSLVVASLAFSTEARAGALEFLHDQLGVTTTNLVFGAPPSAFSGLKRSHDSVNMEVWSMELPGSVPGTFSAGNRSVSYTFVSNRLEAVEVSNGGKATNDQLLATFKEMLEQPVNPATGLANYLYEDGAHRLSYCGLCNPSENWVAIFHLSTEAGERRIQAAAQAAALGPPWFRAQLALSLMAGVRPVAANILMERNGGPVSDLTFHAPAEMKVEVQHPTGTPALDHYNLLFKPDGQGPFIPETWRFSVLFNDATGKRQERVFEVVPAKETNTPPRLEVTPVLE